MKPLRINDIAKAIGAKSIAGGEITAVSTDTRTLPQGCLFVALRGDNASPHTMENARRKAYTALSHLSR